MDRLLSMRAFQRVIDEGGFAAAARAMKMAPAGVTRLVADLEEHLGTRLVHRSTRKFSLTDAGEAYLLRLRSILQEVDDAEAAAAAHTRELEGTIHVLAPPVLTSYVLAPGVAQWYERYPKVKLDLSMDVNPQSRVEEFDLTFLVVPEGYDANIVARALAKTDWIVCASPSYLKRAGLPKAPEDLLRHAYLKPHWTHQQDVTPRKLNLTHIENGSKIELDLQPMLQSDNFDVLLRAALDSVGITILPNLLAAQHLVSGALVRLLPDWMAGQFTIYAALPTRKFMPARTAAFLEFLSERSRTLGAARN
jgi:DNA-binding transcriptional LysR family regulator